MGQKIVGKVISIYQTQKLFKEKTAKMEKFKADGGLHDWIKIAVSPTEEVYVCKHTGWCPSLKGFYPMEYVETIIKQREEAVIFERYKSDQLSSLASRFDLSLDEMDDLYTSVMAIKVNYKIERLGELVKELRDKKNEV